MNLLFFVCSTHSQILNAINFSITKKYNYTVINFYDPDCGHCQEFHPIWKEFEKKNEKNDKLFIGEFNCLNDERFCHKFGIKAFPTIRFIDNLNDVSSDIEPNPYNYEETISKKMQMQIRFIKDDEMLKNIRKGQNRTLFCMCVDKNSQNTAELHMFKEFVLTESSSTEDFFIFETNATKLLAFRKNKEKPLEFTDEFNKKAISTFVYVCSLDDMSPLDMNMYSIFKHSQYSLLILVVESTMDLVKYENEFRGLYANYFLAYSVFNPTGMLVKKYGFAKKQVPLVICVNDTSSFMYTGDIKSAKIRSWLMKTNKNNLMGNVDSTSTKYLFIVVLLCLIIAVPAAFIFMRSIKKTQDQQSLLDLNEQDHSVDAIILSNQSSDN